MDWLQILYNCIAAILGAVIIGVGLYAIVFIPIFLITLAVGIVYSLIRLFLPFLPSFGKWVEESDNKTPRKRFNWGERTEADKHRELVEHIRIQHMNEERNRR